MGVVVYLKIKKKIFWGNVEEETGTILGLCVILKTKHVIWGKCHSMSGIFS